MKRGAILWGTAALTATLALGAASPAMARPPYLAAFKEYYKTAQSKPKLNAVMCNNCHVVPPQTARWNPYGAAVRQALAGGTMVTDRARLVAAFQAAERGRNTAQNKTFGELINADTLPATGLETTVAAQRGQAAAQPAQPVRPTQPAQPAQPRAADPRYGAWVSLFDGATLNGWTKMNQGDWYVENGLLKLRARSGNGWLRSNQQYGNYAMVIVWRYPQPGANDSGIFLKAPMAGSPWPGGPQLNMGPPPSLGNIGGTQGTRPRADLIKANDWNTYQVTVYNGSATLAINGQVAWEQATGIPTGQGYIGIQAENFPLEVAQVWILPIN